MIPTAGLIALAGLCLAGCWLDVSQRRLPNWLSGLALLGGLGLAAATGGFTALGWHGLHALIALVIGMGLFALRVIGAGDAKYYAGLASWFPFFDGLRLFVAVAMAGAIVLLVWAAIRRARGQKIFVRDALPESGVPYGVAIALGSIILAASSGAGQIL
jgi:prepilin peptidase CpaA